MNTKISDQLKIAAETGDVDLLYAVIEDDPYVLGNIDKQEFVETPLHIAAYLGHLRFATEVMNLKPSFALKLNPQGYSPIHLAMQNEQENIVLRFVDINKDLIKIKGREGLTLVHFAVQMGKVELLTKFLIACPESIEYLTARWETALHIAVKNEQYEALEVLVIWLKTNKQKGAEKIENKILNQKDDADNTILHISALNSHQQVIRLLVKTRINLNAKNLDGKTALDMAANVDIERILLSAKAKSSQQITDAPTLAQKLRSSTTIFEKVLTYISRIRRDISDHERDSWLIVATLVATATYQSIVTPPGGVYSANVSDNNMNITSSNSTINNTRPGDVGKSVLSKEDFFVFSFLNMLSFFVTIIAIIFLTPSGRIMGSLVVCPVVGFVLCYLVSMYRISPTHANSVIVNIILYSMAFVIWFISSIIVYSILQQRRNAKKLSRSVKPLVPTGRNTTEGCC